MPKRKNDSQEYLVEKVMGKRMIYGKAEYFIKWENYHQNMNTWEPLSNLLSCISIIAEYENEQEQLEDNKKQKAEDTFKRQQILNGLDINQGHFIRGDVPERIRTVRENNRQSIKFNLNKNEKNTK